MYDKRGSVWRKWDLHVHTPESYEENFGVDWDEYVRQVKAKAIEHEISVMGVTDYFSVDGYEKLVEEYEPLGQPFLELEDGSNLYLIPNVELRLDQFDQDNHSINLHVLFDNINLNPQTIRDCFLDRLRINYRGQVLTCRESDLIKIGHAEANDEAYNANLNLQDIQPQDKIGLKRRAQSLITLSFDDINTKLNELEESLPAAGINSDSFLFAIAAKGHGALSNMPWFFEGAMGRQGNQRQHLLNHSHICFTNHVDDRRFLLGKTDDCPKELFIDRFRNLKSSIWGSDAHDLDNLFHPSNGNSEDYTWIKADPTFIGLKQIIYEPDFRVKVQAEEPVSTLRNIDNVKIDIDKELIAKNINQDEEEPFCFNGQKTIHFSPNLNCIIGGRGAGKSTLLNMIHRKIKPDENHFFQDEVKLLNTDKESEDISDYIEVDHNTGEKIEFLNQNEIEKFALDNKKFTDAIYQRLITGEGGSELNECSMENRNYISSIDEAIKYLVEAINLDEELDQLNTDLNSKQSLIEFLEDDEYVELQESIDNTSQALSTIRRSRNKLGSLLSDLKEITEKYSVQVEDTENKFERTVKRIVDAANWLINRYSEQTEEVSQEERELQQELEGYREELSLFLQEKEVEEDSIRDLASAQEKANELKSEIREKEHRKEVVQQKINSFEIDVAPKDDFESKLRVLLSPVNDRLQEISEESDQVKRIELKYEYDYNSAPKDLCAELLENFIPSMDGGRTAGLPYVQEIVMELLDDEMRVPDLAIIIERLQDYSSSPKTAELFSEFFEKEKNYQLFKLLTEKYKTDVNSYKIIKVKYDDRAIESSSFGQRCTAAIVILLSMGNTPIVIDEPEAHLDSALIAKYLVELIKKRKQQRQIIFATHNANFVINGDAELIHILEMDDDNFTQIQPTTIENMEYRDILVNLEGGKDAFIQRERKYDFPR